jgi:mannose-6-phosphate isomerase-like protein (cupin superfamily)
MAEPGDTFTLREGETVTVRTASAQSGGELLELDAEWSPLGGHKPPPPHYHPSQDEHFEVREGELSLEMNGATRVLRAGDTVDVPRGTVHKMWNSGGSVARASWQVRPAQRTEDMFRTVHELMASGRHGKDGQLTPLGGGVILEAFPDEFRIPLPGFLQRPLAVALAAVARLRGYPRVERQ